MKFKLAFIIAVSASVLFYFLKAKNSSQVLEDVIIVGTESSYPPYEFMENGVLKGFEIELVEEIGKRLGKKIVFKDMSFDHLLFAAESGQIHLIAAALTPTENRSKQVLFTQSFSEDSSIVLLSLKEDPINNFKELTGKTLIINDGYSYNIDEVEKLTLLKIPTPIEALTALKYKKAHAYLLSKQAVHSYIKKIGQDLFHQKDLDLNEKTAIAISPLYSKYLEPINLALTELKQEGFIKDLTKKWFFDEVLQ